MISRLLKTAVLPVLAAAVIAASPVAAHAAGDALSKSDVEKIVHEYIAKNPQEVLDAVDNYQKKAVQERRDSGMAKGKDALYNDAGSPSAGNPKGDVTVVEFMDYNCHFCKDALPTVLSLLDRDKNLRFVFKDIPILGPTSETAAKWALAANKQGKYFDYHTLLMKNRGPITNDLLENLAQKAGLDVARMKKDVASTEVMIQIEKNRSLAATLQINGTPGFVIGDEIIPGALGLEQLQQKIDALRQQKAGKAR